MKAESYLSRGVSPTKDDVKKAVAGQDRGLFPGAFCKIIEDLAGDDDYCMAVHADGAGTKSSLAYLMQQESGDPKWFSGIAQDALVMNTDDLACIGAVSGFLVSNTIGRNAHRIDRAALQAIISGYDRLIADLEQRGIKITMTGGETADVGDLVRTVICDSTVTVRLAKKEVIDASRIKPGKVIVGLSSTGKTDYEQEENSGMGSNGLTAARHLLLSSAYRKRYPESYSETIPEDKVYCGPYRLEDKLPQSELSIGQALLSPTRTYLPVLSKVYDLYRDQIDGVLHCTGGGQVKCRDFGHGVHYIKDNLFARPPLFEAIAQTGSIQPAELYQVFNMGHRLEIYCDQACAQAIIEVSQSFGLDAKIIGRTEASDKGDNEVTICDQGAEYHYEGSE